jgi:DNA gyrase/topoisomerase IV subunit B
VTTKTYDAESIAMLEGLEHVRKRPGMYIGGTGADGLHHLLWEIVDNCVDEAINGHASLITVTLHSSGDTCTVVDNGRGIPVDMHKQAKKSALEVVLTTLGAGAKFDQGAYKAAGGLHGVGSSVVNALSSKMEARIRRDGQEWVQEYHKGRPKEPVKAVGPTRGTGTSITFTPDREIFEETTFDAERIRAHLEVSSYLHRGLKVVFKDQVAKVVHEMQHDGGIVDYLNAVATKEGAIPVVDAPFAHDRDDDELRYELALIWTDSPKEHLLSYVNGIVTRDGGTHEQGLKDALGKAVRGFMETHDLVPRNLQITSEDLREGVVAILSLYLGNPQFQGQTKGRLNNPEVAAALSGSIRPVLEGWLHTNRRRGEAIVNRAAQAARARLASREAAQLVRRKGPASSRLNLPGKLADCSSSDPSETELFIVEGQSAGGTAKQGRDRRTQAILPLRGKVLNAEQATLTKVLENEELNNIVTALGCGAGADFREDRLRYQRVVLLMDADSDGHHITTLMLTFLYRYLPGLIERGYVYIAQPPLFRINVGKETHWALDERDRDRILKRLGPRAKPEITRFKGLGEMPAETLFETTLDPERRRLLQVTIPDVAQADGALVELMGKDPQSRFRFIMERAADVDVLDV